MNTKDFIIFKRKVNSSRDLIRFKKDQPKYFYYNLKDSTVARLLLGHTRSNPLAEALNVPTFKSLSSAPKETVSKPEEDAISILRAKAQTEEVFCNLCEDPLEIVRHAPRLTSRLAFRASSSSYEPKELQSCACGNTKCLVDHTGILRVYSADLLNVSLKYWIELPSGFIQREHNLGLETVLDVPHSFFGTTKFTDSFHSYNNHKLNPTPFLTTHGIPEEYEILVFPKFKLIGTKLKVTKNGEELLDRLKEYPEVNVLGKPISSSNVKLKKSLEVPCEYSRTYAQKYLIIISDSTGIYLPSGVFIKPSSYFYKKILRPRLGLTKDHRVPRSKYNDMIQLLKEHHIPITIRRGSLVRDLMRYPKAIIGFLPYHQGKTKDLFQISQGALESVTTLYAFAKSDTKLPNHENDERATNREFIPQFYGSAKDPLLNTVRGYPYVAKHLNVKLINQKTLVYFLWASLSHKGTKAYKVLKSKELMERVKLLELAELSYDTIKLRLPIEVLKWNKIINQSSSFLNEEITKAFTHRLLFLEHPLRSTKEN